MRERRKAGGEHKTEKQLKALERGMGEIKP